MDARLEWSRFEKNREILSSIQNEDLENPAFNFFAEIPGQEAFTLNFRCECAKSGCSKRLPLNLSQFRRIHRSKNRFVVHPEHVVPEIETVEQSHKGFVVVEKKPGFRPRDLIPDIGKPKSGDSSPGPSEGAT